MTEPRMVTCTIDGLAVTAPEGTLLTDAARMLGIQIPIFCSHHRLQPLGACRICLIEKEKVGKPVIACAEMVAEGAVFHTQSEMALKARKGIMEYLLVNHPLDCPICDEGGECDLQDTSYEHGIAETRFVEMKRDFDIVDLGPIVVLDRNRCIVCARCVRYCQDIMGDSALTIEERGFHSQINTKDGGELDCQQCGNCIEVCPVGALTSRPYRFKARPWDLKQTETVCNFCSNGCTFHLGRRDSKLVRARAKKSHGVNRDFLCTRGRYGYEFPTSPERLQHPRARLGGSLERAEWSEALGQAVRAIQAARTAGKAVVGLASARLSNEDLYLFQRLIREVAGSPHLDHRLEVRAPLPGSLLKSLAAFPALPVSAISSLGSALVFGEDVNEEQPLYGTSLLREMHYRKMPVVVAHSRQVRLMQDAAAGLQYRSGSELAAARGLLKAMAAHASAGGPAEEVRRMTSGWNWEALASSSGLEQARFEKAAATLFAGQARAIYFGSQALRSADAPEVVSALIDMALVSGSSLVPLWDRSNSQGAVDMGVLPDLAPGYSAASPAGWNTAEILRRSAAGEVGVLILAGADPLAHFPDRKLAELALRKAGFVLSLDLFETGASELSNVSLPLRSYAESDGTVTSSERRVQSLRSAANPVGESEAGWRIFARLAAGLGTDWNYPDLLALQEAIRSSVPLYKVLGRRMGPAAGCWALDGARLPEVQPVGEGKAPPPVAAGMLRVETGNSIFHHGMLSQQNPVQMKLLPGPTLFLEEVDAGRLRVADGDLALLEGPGGKIEARVKLGGPSGPGVGFYPDHFEGAEANRLFGPDQAFVDVKISTLSAAVHS